MKLNLHGGRTKLVPTEILKILPGRADVKTMLSNLVTEITESCPDISDKIIKNLACTDCSEEMFGDDKNYFLDLKTHKLNEDLTILVNSRWTFALHINRIVRGISWISILPKPQTSSF